MFWSGSLSLNSFCIIKMQNSTFHVLVDTSESRVKFADSDGIFLSPRYLDTDRSQAEI